MDKFLNKVAKHVLAKHGNNLAHVSVILPTHRSCIYFKQALQLNAESPIWAPEIITLKDWVYAQSNLVFMQPLQQMVQLFAVYKLRGGEETFDEFIGMAETMLHDFNEVDLHLAPSKPFFDYLEQLQSLKVYEPGAEPTKYAIKYRRFWEMFKELYFGFKQKLLEQGKGYEGMIYRDVAERLDKLDVEKDWQPFVIGINGLSKSEEAIVRGLKDLYAAEVILDSDRYYVNDEFNEAGHFLRKYKREWHLDVKPWQHDLIGLQPKQVNIIGVAKSIGQTKVLADIVANKLKLNEETQKETALVVPDETLLNSLLGNMPDNITALNVTMGYPLRESQIVKLLWLLFALHDNVLRFRSRNNKLRFYYKDVFDVLHHPYVAYLMPDKQAVTTFIQHVRDRNKMVVSYDELAVAFSGSQFDKIFWYDDNPTTYINKLLALIETLRVMLLQQKAVKDVSVDVELLFNVNTLLNNLLEAVKETGDELTGPLLRKLLHESLKNMRVPFEGEPVLGLQILGTLETRCLDFKNVIVLSANEGTFPAGKKLNSYIPYEMRNEFLSTYRDKDAISAYLFYRLLQHAENIYLVYNTESDDLGGGEKSRFILQLEHELRKANKQAVINDLIYSVDPPPALPEEDIVISKDGSLIEKLVAQLADKGISPSALNTYINCSLQYYLRYVAGLYEQDEVEENIEAATLGSAVHDVLEKLYRPKVKQIITADFVEQIAADKKRIQELLNKSFEERFDAESLKRGKNYLLYRVCLKLLDEFFKQEKATLKMLDDSGSEMKLLMLENKMTQPLTIGPHAIKVQGKVDRVEDANGIISVADYKTGNPDASGIKSDDVALFSTDPKYAKAMQLLTYAWLYWRNIGSPDIQLRTGIYWLRQIARGFDPLRIDKGDIITRETLLQFEGVLKGVLTELLNPEVPFAKTKDVERCVNCEFVRICRRD